RCDFRREGAHKAGLVDLGVAHMAVEVAIGTFRQAKRPVNIDAELWRIAFASRRSVRRIPTIQDRPPRVSETREHGAKVLCLSEAARASPRWASHRTCARARQAERS